MQLWRQTYICDDYICILLLRVSIYLLNFHFNMKVFKIVIEYSIGDIHISTNVHICGLSGVAFIATILI